MPELKATVLTIGDELLIGQVVNSNAAWIGEQLTGLGVEVMRMLTVSDDEDEIRRFLALSLEDSDIVIVTGGLGPTHDDITKTAVAAHFGVSLERDEAILEHIRARFKRRGRSMSSSVHPQADVPEGFEAIPNDHGTAPGLLNEWTGENGRRLLALMPGVPHEMKELMREGVLPRVSDMVNGRVIRRRTLLTTGVGESDLHDRLEGLDGKLSDSVSVAFLPNVSGVRLRITGRAESEAEADEAVRGVESWIRDRLGSIVFGEGSERLEGVVGRLLSERGSTLAVAESCTGGLLGSRITDVQGSSGYFRGGVVSYSNHAKWELISVDRAAIESEGAVSREVAVQMAEGVRARLGSDIGLATTGVMGPGGGSEDKPVGTLWMALAWSDGARALRVQLGSDRERNKERAATAALNMLRLWLIKSAKESG